VPLLLRLAAGEAARKGTEPPPIELRSAAAEAVIPLVGPAELPALAKLAADPEMRVRLAAVVALGRIGTPATRELERALDDPHERVAAAACMGLPDDAQVSNPRRLVALAYDVARPLAARACGVQLGRRLAAMGSSPARTALVARLLEGDWRSQLRPGVARALLDAGVPAATQAGLRALLTDPALHRPTSLEAAPLVPVDLPAAIARAESAPPPVQDPAALRAAYGALLGGDDASTALADLLVEHPLMPRLLGDTAPASAAAVDDGRARLLDEVAPQLAALARRPRDRDPTARALAITLASERATSLKVLLEALARGTDRRTALVALSGPRARVLGADDADAMAPLVRAAFSAPDWRERRAALACVRRQPELERRLVNETRRLKDDTNALVSQLAPD